MDDETIGDRMSQMEGRLKRVGCGSKYKYLLILTDSLQIEDMLEQMMDRLEG